MRKTNHILHGALTLLTVGIWGIGWLLVVLRNWSYNESHGFNEHESNIQGYVPPPKPASIIYDGPGSYVLVPAGVLIGQIDENEEDVAPPSFEPTIPKTPEIETTTAQPAVKGTFLPKEPFKPRSVYGESEVREFGLDEELTKMFEEIGVTDPEDMQKIVDAALADIATQAPRNRLLFSFGKYAKSLIEVNALDISLETNPEVKAAAE